MAALSSSIKTSKPLHIFSIKPPSSKLKTLFRTFVFSHMYRIARAFAKAKSLLLSHVRDMQFLHLAEFKKGKRYNSSFRLHYNWCASHVYYDASWNVVVPATTTVTRDGTTTSELGLSRYLEWLEEKGSCNEIDKLADMFIADCHEKFRLEKQDSYRRFQEMMARN